MGDGQLKGASDDERSRRVAKSRSGKEKLAYSRGERGVGVYQGGGKDGVAVILGAADEQGKGRLKYNLKTKRAVLHKHIHTHTHTCTYTHTHTHIQTHTTL